MRRKYLSPKVEISTYVVTELCASSPQDNGEQAESRTRFYDEESYQQQAEFGNLW